MNPSFDKLRMSGWVERYLKGSKKTVPLTTRLFSPTGVHASAVTQRAGSDSDSTVGGCPV